MYNVICMMSVSTCLLDFNKKRTQKFSVKQTSEKGSDNFNFREMKIQQICFVERHDVGPLIR